MASTKHPNQGIMNVLFLADPNSIHDIKWIGYFTSRGLLRGLLLPRQTHWPDPERTISDLNIRIVGTIRDFSIRRFFRTIVDAVYIKKIIVRNKVDLINIHYAEPNALWCLFRWYFRVPMIITTLGTDVLVTIPQTFSNKTLINYLVAPAYRLAFKRADWITSTSDTQVKSIIRFSGRRTNMTIIRTGVDMVRVTADNAATLPMKNDSHYILFPRYIKPIYNHEFSLRAIALLPSSVKAKYSMVFLGRGAGDLRYQQELERQMRAQSDVRFEFLEKQDQETLFALYRNAEVVVMCPLSDGSPVSGMEALICGAKLILGPLNYDLEIFSRAIRMQAWDADELAHLIVQALEDEERPQLSAEEIALMDRDTNMKKMWAIYQSLIDLKG